ncbi:MAG TPA: dicarboxylate/amino acid:cation symporter [Candidatus Methylacidiphilales bacterium]|nr:dicarboxylate/amino acid:cation symporter [Candidatus Methylacidiphilales bacterium]
MQIIVALIIGGTLGLLFGGSVSPETMKDVIEPIGRLFLKIITMVIVPLVLGAIILGIQEMGDLGNLGKVGLKCMLVTIVLAGSGVFIGLFLVNTLKPGSYISQEKKDALQQEYAKDGQKSVDQAGKAKSISQTLQSLIPVNPINAAAAVFTDADDGSALLSLMMFAVLVGIAVLLSPPETMKGFVDFLRGMFAMTLKVIDLAMLLAPIGVFCLSFKLTATLGLGVFTTLGLYIFTVLLGLGLHLFVTYGIVLKLAGKSPFAFAREIREATVMAFASSSSNATLPVSMRVAEENLKLPPRISRFVLTVGASANQNGTALYEGVTVLFLAQVFGIDLTLGQQIQVAIMCMLAGIGTAGVPGGSLPLVVGVLVTVGVPPGAIAIILGVDRLLDMCRTVLNVVGDLVCAVVVAKGEPIHPEEVIPGVNDGSPASPPASA